MSHSSCKRSHSVFTSIRPKSALPFERNDAKSNLLREFLDADQWRDRKSVRDYFHSFLKQQNRLLAYYGFAIIGLLTIVLVCLVALLFRNYFDTEKMEKTGKIITKLHSTTVTTSPQITTTETVSNVPTPANCQKILSSIRFQRSSIILTICTPSSAMSFNFIAVFYDRSTKVQHQISSAKAEQLFEYLAECYESNQCWTNQQPLPTVSCSSYQVCDRWTLLSSDSRDIMFCNPGNSTNNLIHMIRIGNVKLVCSQIWFLFKELQKYVV